MPRDWTRLRPGGGTDRSARATGIAPKIDTELAQYVVRQAPIGFAIGSLAIVGIVVVLWNAAPRGRLLVWVATILVLSLPACVVVWRFARARDVASTIGWWQRALTVAYGLAGVGWGVAAILVYPHVATPYQPFLLFILGGAGVSGIAALAPVRPAFIAYLTAIFLPLVAQLLAGGSLSSRATGLLLATFWVSTLALASALRALLVGSLRLRFENVELIGDLSRAKDEAEAASRTKSALLANVSHELRTPLALILGPIRKLLAEGPVDMPSRRDLETVERNAQALLKHVSDLLDVATLETGRMDLDRSPVDLVELVRRTASLFDVVARERGVHLSLETPVSVPLVVDAVKLERVLLNLLSNAMKFTPDGGRVRMAVAVEGGAVTLAVDDSGPGVPVALRDAIFERFRRGDDATTRRFGGTGLGLAIVKDIVERHGGTIDAGESADGGASFQVKLPIAAVATGVAPSAAPEDRAARNALAEVARQTVAELQGRPELAAAMSGNGGRGLVLVVEDHPDMNRFVVECLASQYRVASAFDGRQGLAKAVELRPDVIVTDLMMPGMSGDLLVRELRAHHELDGVPIIVLTARTDEDLRITLLREGAQDFLTKPVATEELRARVSNFVTLKRTRDVLEAALSSKGRDLETLADELAAANRTKEEFLAIVSHELRTPLTPILTWASSLLRRTVDAATLDRGLRAIERNAKLQLRIVEDLLDMSRVITGKLRLDVRPITVDEVVHAAMDTLRPAADAKGVHVEAILDPDMSWVSGDPERLQQVVWNLISNAVKFTPRGGRIEIRLTHADDAVRLTVSDNGAGIDRESLPRLFERFWQSDSSSIRAHGGLGLGLAVVRHLVELHGGTVRAESEGEGRGAAFIVTLPALAVAPSTDDEPMQSAKDSPTNAARLRGLKLMVVDDDEDTCHVIARVLETEGAEVRTCLSAEEALRVLETWVPNILVSDIAMPGEDGYTLIRKIRARTAQEGGGMAAVALTAYDGSEDRKKALSAGFQIHIGKPFEPTQLIGIVESVAGHRPVSLH